MFNRYSNSDSNLSNMLNLYLTNVLTANKNFCHIDEQNAMLTNSMNLYNLSSYLENGYNSNLKINSNHQTKNICNDDINTTLLQPQPITSSFIKNQSNKSLQSSTLSKNILQYNQNLTTEKNNIIPKTNSIFLKNDQKLSNCSKVNEEKNFKFIE